jgi:serine phosphatase RsbU (regulator of sigma subunit)
VGFALGIVLFIQTLTTYRYVAGSMMMEQAERDAQRKVNTLVGAVRAAQTQDLEKVKAILEEFFADWSEQVAWIRILDSNGAVQTSVGPAPFDPPTREQMERRFSENTILPDTQNSPSGPVLVSLRSFRTVPFTLVPNRARGGFEPPRANQGQAQPGFGQGEGRGNGGRGRLPAQGPTWSVEIAILRESVTGSFAPLRQNLIIGVSAALALMAALVLIAFRFPNYLRGQQIERELDLARRVQADLLPSSETISPYVDFSAECISAWQVGGDFCDVFHVADERTALVLGDVSGKGISAALLMALVHGAIHSVSWTRSTQDHLNSTRRLNSLLCKKTASERFTSLFWGCFDPQRSTIQYINAGHLPPMLIRMVNNELQIHRLETGGPVLGLLPGADYEQGEQYVAPGDILVAFSDGVVEATNAAGEDFGENRLIAAIRDLWDAPANDILNSMHSRLKEFTGNTPINDDQTLIVVRFKHTTANLEAPEAHKASVG